MGGYYEGVGLRGVVAIFLFARLTSNWGSILPSEWRVQFDLTLMLLVANFANTK